MEVIKFLSVIFIATILDIVCVFYLISIEKREKIKASFLCSLYILLQSLIVILFVEDKKMIIGSTIGGFIGTFLSIKYKK